ncbi:MAG: hypothetical protein Q7J98_00100, partial [Kiritimatiellia bacterium]|nr:hypothetical protein [Kiritimatiellia bacterium]
ILRPAQVVVSSGKSAPPQTETNNQSSEDKPQLFTKKSMKFKKNICYPSLADARAGGQVLHG